MFNALRVGYSVLRYRGGVGQWAWAIHRAARHCVADQVLEFVELNDKRDMLAIARSLIQVIRKLREQGYTMTLVEQNVQMALAVSDYAYVMSHGRIEIEGEARQVRAMESVRKAFLGV